MLLFPQILHGILGLSGLVLKVVKWLALIGDLVNLYLAYFKVIFLSFELLDLLIFVY